MTAAQKHHGRQHLGRPFPHNVVRLNVRNQSARTGRPLTLIVVHDTEGANIKGPKDLAGLAGYFDIAATEASSTVATDADGTSARFVPDDRKAWHCAYYNDISLGIEQIGFATLQHWPELQLMETARWIAYWSRKHGIPIQHGAVSLDGRVLRPGVIRHSELGNLGGNHKDPGDPYPLGQAIRYGRHYRALQAAHT